MDKCAIDKSLGLIVLHLLSSNNAGAIKGRCWSTIAYQKTGWFERSLNACFIAITPK